MTMKQRKPGVVRREINLDFLIAADHHDIFHNARSHLAAYLSQFETVAMQMDRMNIVTCVLHAKTVTPAFLHRPHGLHVLLGKRDIIDRPQVEAILSGILLGKTSSRRSGQVLGSRLCGQSGHSSSETVLEKPIATYLSPRHIRPRYPGRDGDRRPPDHP